MQGSEDFTDERAVRLLSVKQALSALGIGRTLLYELIEVGSLKSVKIGRRRLVPFSEIEAFIARSRV
jgi:excisionase family DNA binding protein